MTIDRPERKGFVAVLIAAALMIWGYNLYQIATGIESETDAAAAAPLLRLPAADERQTSDMVRVPYAGDFPDPFHPKWRSRAKQPAATHEDAAPQTPEPSLQLHGIVGETAIIRTADGLVFVAHAGESVGETRIVRVAADHVVLEVRGRRTTLTIAE